VRWRASAHTAADAAVVICSLPVRLDSGAQPNRNYNYRIVCDYGFSDAF
jgi:hypothetical protein